MMDRLKTKIKEIKSSCQMDDAYDDFCGYLPDGTYISIQKERTKFASFYIRVKDPRGCYMYDGYAPSSANTLHKAILEAIDGAMLLD